MIRKQAALANRQAPRSRTYEHLTTIPKSDCRGCVAVAGSACAAASGASVMLCEQSAYWGGRADCGAVIDGKPADEWINAPLTT